MFFTYSFILTALFNVKHIDILPGSVFLLVASSLGKRASINALGVGKLPASEVGQAFAFLGPDSLGEAATL